jgi:hypothetical protein
MARLLHFKYPGTVYHFMARGDGGKFIYESQDGCLLFLDRLGRVCGSHGWRVYAWVLMGNHFHLLLETPEPNLVSGMGVLLGWFAHGESFPTVRVFLSPHFLPSFPCPHFPALISLPSFPMPSFPMPWRTSTPASPGRGASCCARGPASRESPSSSATSRFPNSTAPSPASPARAPANSVSTPIRRRSDRPRRRGNPARWPA